jgi:hypothetical protein
MRQKKKNNKKKDVIRSKYAILYINGWLIRCKGKKSPTPE